jgi:hypothetical protein
LITFITLLKGVSHHRSTVDPWDELALEAQDLSSIFCREGKRGPFRNLERISTQSRSAVNSLPVFFLELPHIIIIGNEVLEFRVEIVAGTDKLHHLLVREFVPRVLFP